MSDQGPSSSMLRSTYDPGHLTVNLSRIKLQLMECLTLNLATPMSWVFDGTPLQTP